MGQIFGGLHRVLSKNSKISVSSDVDNDMIELQDLDAEETLFIPRAKSVKVRSLFI